MNIPNGTWTIDPAHSEVEFTVRHLMISKVRGYFGVFEGTAITTDHLEKTHIKATVNTTTVTTNDENRDNHLRSADFFDVENYPQMTFVSTTVEQTEKEDVVLLRGDLTIRDVTRPVTFVVEIGGVNTDAQGRTKAAAEATTTINRTDYGLTWNATLETGGVLVSEEVKITVSAQAVLEQ